MSSRHRIGNQRRIGFRNPKKFFFISMEGAETEPRYFEEFKTEREAEIQIKLVPNPKHKSKPTEVLQRLRQYMRQNATREGDEAWIVIDRNSWPEAELDQVCREAAGLGYFVAVSNPCFELWLYLHLRDNRPFPDRHDCQRELARALPSYSPGKKSSYDVADVAVLIEGVEAAIQRATALDVNPGQPWPRTQATRVYRLVQKLRAGH
jgi:hypothetical protein